MTRVPAESLIEQCRTLLGIRGLEHIADVDLLHSFMERRDETAFAALVRRHGDRVLRICRHVLRQEADAEDAFQATFLILARNAGSIRKRTSLSSWLHGVAVRCAKNLRKNAMRRAKIENAATVRSAASESPISQAALGELQSSLDAEIARLPEKYRAPFLLVCFEGRSREEVALVLGCKEGTVASRVATARERLQKRLTARGVTLSAALAATLVPQSEVSAAVAAGLARTTVDAALAFVTRNGVAVVSSQALAVAEGVMRGMRMTKLTIVLFAAVAASLTLVAIGGFTASPNALDAQEAKSPVAPPEPRVGNDAGAKDEKRRLEDAPGDPLPDGAVARLGARRFRHEDSAKLAYTPDGKSLVGLTSSGIYVWDATTGFEQAHHRVGNGMEGMAISPDGKILAVMGDRNRPGITLWGLRSGKEILIPVPARMDSRLVRISCTPDGKLLAASHSARGQSFVFDVATGRIRTVLGDRNGDLNERYCFSLAFSPDGKTMAAAFCDQPNPIDTAKHDVHLLEAPNGKLSKVSTGKLIRVLLESRTGGIPTMPLAFSPDGKSVACGIDKKITLCDTATGKSLTSFDTEFLPRDLVFTPDGTRLVSSGGSNDQEDRVQIWDIATKKVVHALVGRMPQGFSAAISPDGKTVALGGGRNGGIVQRWATATGKELFTENQGHNARIRDQVFSPDGKTLVTTSSRQTILWDTATWKRSGSLPWGAGMDWKPGTPPFGSGIEECAPTLSFSPDGKILAAIEEPAQETNSASAPTTVRIWDMAARKDVMKLAASDIRNVESVRFSVDGREIYTIDQGPRNEPEGACVRHWDISTGKQTERLPISWKGHLALAPDGKTAFAAHSYPSADVTRVDLKTGREQFVGPANNDLSHRPVLSSDCRYVAFTVQHKVTHYWEHAASTRVCEVVSGEEILFLKGHHSNDIKYAWSPDGRILATGTARDNIDGPTPEPTIRLWDMAAGNEIKTFDGIKSDTSVLTFAPDGKSLVAGLYDGSLLVFDVTKIDLRPKRAPALSDDDLQACWTDLSGEAVQANQAAWRLADAGLASVRFLREQLKPVPLADAVKVRGWIVDLGSEAFAIREAASRKLSDAGDQMRLPIRKALEGDLPLESKRRLRRILKTLIESPTTEAIRSRRAIMVLERIGDSEARNALEAVSRGEPGASVTEEATLALQRLRVRSSTRR